MHGLYSIHHNGDNVCFFVWLKPFPNCIGYRKPNKTITNDELEKVTGDGVFFFLKDYPTVCVKQVKKYTTKRFLG
jgi:hypothetical protein